MSQDKAIDKLQTWHEFEKITKFFSFERLEMPALSDNRTHLVLSP